MGESVQKEIKYTFRQIEQCNMCGSLSGTHKILGRRLNQSQGINPDRKTGISVAVVRCTNCGLVYSNPQPVPADIQDHYGISPEGYWKEDYFFVNDKFFRGEVKVLNKLMKYEAGAKSLDIGAGIGKGMIAYSRGGFDAYGLEPSEPFYRMAVERMKVSPEKLKCASVEEADFPENFFDYITFKSVLEHIYDPSVSVVKAMKWLKPGGIMQVEVPSSDWLINRLINLYYFLKCSSFVGNISPMHSPFHLYEFTPKSFIEHSKKHSYEIAFHQYYAGDIPMPRLIEPMLKTFMLKTDSGMELCMWLRKK